MKTDDLIHQLGRELEPVRRLSPAWQRAGRWLAYSVAYVAVIASIAWIRRGSLGFNSAGPYLLQQVALALLGVVAALAAFASVIPGATTRTRAALGLPLLMMMVALVWGATRDLAQFGTLGVGRETDWPCVFSITLGSMVLWTAGGAMLTRGAVFQPRLTAALAGIAAVSVANVEACISRIHGFTATVIIWHGATVGVMMLALVGLGPSLLRRRFRT